MSRIRFVPVLLIFGVALTVLFGGWIVYRDYGLVRPLTQELTDFKQVETVAVKFTGSNKQVEVTLKQVPDLQTAFREIQSKVQEGMHTDFPIRIHDRRTLELERLFQSLQPIIYSGIDRANYTEMIDAIEKRAAKDGVHALITMDRDYLYVQLETDPHYLYEVIPYREKPTTPEQGVKTI
jgi:hypothetical protein